MHLSQIRDCFSSICQFFSYSKTNSPTHIPSQSPTPQMSQTSSMSFHQVNPSNPLKPINMNTNLGSLTSITITENMHKKHPSISEMKNCKNVSSINPPKSAISQNTFYNGNGANNSYTYKYENVDKR